MSITQSTRAFHLEDFYFRNSLPQTFRARHYGSQALLVGSFVYVTGITSIQRTTTEAAVLLVDTVSGHVRLIEINNAPLMHFHSCILWGDSLYLYGGIPRNDLAENRMWRFDLVLHDFAGVDERGTKPLLQPRYCAGGLIETKGQFLIVATVDNQEIPTVVRVRLFDLVSRKWTLPDVSGKQPPCRMFAASCMVNSCFYLVGGWFGVYDTNDMYILDCRNDILEWSEISLDLNQPLPRMPTLTPIPSTTFLILGGGVAAPFARERSTKFRIFDTASQKWRAIMEHRTPVTPEEKREMFTVDGNLTEKLVGHCTVATDKGILLLGGDCAKPLLLKKL